MSEIIRDRTFDERLSAFADGELGAEEAEEIRRLLEADPAARALLEDFQAMSTALRATLEEIGEEADFEGFADRVMARLEPERPAAAPAPEKRRRFEWWVRRRAPLFAGAAALAALAVVVGPGLWDDSTTERVLLAGDPADAQVLAMSTQGEHGATLFKTSEGTTIIYLTGK